MRQRRRWVPGAAAAAAAIAVATAVHACGGNGGNGGTGPAGPVAELELVGLAAGPLSLNPGGSRSVTVRAVDEDGDEVGNADLTARSSNEAVATVTGGASASRVRLAATSFTVRAVAAGEATITFEHAATATRRDLAVSVELGSATVTILVGNDNFSFRQGSVSNGTTTVGRGTRVVWDWTDIVPHTTTSDAGVWDSGTRTGLDQQFAFTFNTPGAFPYHCRIHGNAGGAGMSGTIVVTP